MNSKLITKHVAPLSNNTSVNQNSYLVELSSVIVDVKLILKGN